MNQDTIGKVADATGEVAKTADTGLQLAGRFGSVFIGPLRTAANLIDNELKFIVAKRGLALSEKWDKLMDARGLPAPTRALPVNFVLPLLSAAVLEEDDELQQTWARLLVNAGDAATKMELRTAYVEILRGMSAFDVRNLSMMAKAALAGAPEDLNAVTAYNLPHLSEPYTGSLRDVPSVPKELGISLGNLFRLGCASPGGGFGGGVVFFVMTVTDLGLALYQACS